MESFEEIELKLDIAPDGIAALGRAAELAGMPRRRRKQVSVYFDTAGQDLRDAGLSLRIRRAGGKRIQTVKAESAAAAGLFARQEWEQEIAGDEPVLDGATDGLARLLAHTELAGLGAAFSSRVDRTVWDVTFEDARIELVLDDGAVAAGDRVDPVCEIELELREGEPAALFALARALGARAPLRLGVLTKSERGYRLLDGKPRRSITAEPVALADDVTVAAAFQAIARSCLRQYRLNETLLLRDRGARALHQARVALRRLRSALSVFKPAVADERFEHFRAELRWLAGELGQARDIDVLLARAGASPYAEPLAAARTRSYDAVCAALASPRCTGLMLALAEWIAIGPWLTMTDGAEVRGGAAADFATTLLDRYRKRIRRRGRHLARLDDEDRHEVRILAKKLRYAAEFFAALHDGKRQRKRRVAFLAALEALQSHLGDLNDHATGRELLAALGIPEDAAATLLDSHVDRPRLLSEAGDVFDTLVDGKRFWR